MQRIEKIDDANTDPRFPFDLERSTGLKFNNMMAAPLQSGRGQLGVVIVVNKRGLLDTLLFLIHLIPVVGPCTFLSLVI
jgi:hypothetical protein